MKNALFAAIIAGFVMSSAAFAADATTATTGTAAKDTTTATTTKEAAAPTTTESEAHGKMAKGHKHTAKKTEKTETTTKAAE